MLGLLQAGALGSQPRVPRHQHHAPGLGGLNQFFRESLPDGVRLDGHGVVDEGLGEGGGEGGEPRLQVVHIHQVLSGVSMENLLFFFIITKDGGVVTREGWSSVRSPLASTSFTTGWRAAILCCKYTGVVRCTGVSWCGNTAPSHRVFILKISPKWVFLTSLNFKSAYIFFCLVLQ